MDCRGVFFIDLFGMASEQVSRMEGGLPGGPRLQLSRVVGVVCVSYLPSGHVPALDDQRHSLHGTASGPGEELGRGQGAAV